MSALSSDSNPAPIRPQPALGKAHARRLREIYRSAGWPCQDPLEIELLAAGLLDRVHAPSGHESLRVTDAGVQLLATTLTANRAAFSAHEALVERVAQEMGRAGRIAWRGLALRAQVPAECGVLVVEQGRLVVARAAPRRSRNGLPFGVWMALAKATPVTGLDGDAQALLA